ncbi:flavin reductase (DIM6/NTAB) family NADH-FMN oxidoreductase RutF [Microbacterium endophyticum]|uniref:Flavin reductase (DIM6/NTAB) family NADH-FMN oxidoreductase RutF n=1 Tax=Microbacterium endophyticum TaxID=1526412 RepID=A0A7W4YMV6_9MICO|nr:flavin reductase family protein [Microbacterium endophyticum]MBB2975487.1 flavin reductase (DIM6/NTAB) family NADH-FMN oxidoreductase RutF [Microbacterium endophyticum]NIK35494.1 flavin reductase (DIM6/NTAB) family NADH-FMN oxidoreductase RutF [Microbacterium endophyticum]
MSATTTVFPPEVQTPPLRSLTPVSDEPAHVRGAFGRFPSGVAALCATINGQKVGMVATSFSVGVSYSPAMVMFSVQNSSATWPVLATADRIGVSVLGGTHADACMQLASRRGDRFAGLDVTATDAGALFIGGSTMWLECEVVSTTPAGDHQIVVMQVHAMSVDHETHPLVYQQQRFHHLATLAAV